MKKFAEIATVLLTGTLVLGLSLSAALLADQELSETERRRLAQKPETNWETLTSGDYGQQVEAYLQDQFPQRDGLRRLIATLRTTALGQRDNNGYYVVDGSLCKLETKVDEAQIQWAAGKMSSVWEKYLQDCNVRWAIIPDKGQYTPGYPSLDMAQLSALLAAGLPMEFQRLEISDLLTLESYYKTDSHWRQEEILPVAERILKVFGAESPARDYEEMRLSGFRGVYFGQSGLRAEPEELIYLTDKVTENALVGSAELAGTLPVYDREKFAGMDGYDVFLHGAQAVLTLENPLAETERELVVFRDSFGSALAPLLLGGYAKVTLVDLRYVASDFLGEFVDIAPGSDVLFLYSTGLVNSGMLLK